MHSDPEAIKKSIRSYMVVGALLLVFTGVTVAANQFHLAVPAAITLALIIATIKGSMVASVFMHLSHEKKWIYGALLLTVVFFVVLLFLPLLTVAGGIGTPTGQPRTMPRRTRRTDMSLKAFHLVFIVASGLLAAFCAAWAVNQYRADPSGVYLAGAVAVGRVRRRAGRVRHDVPAQDEEPVMATSVATVAVA